MGNGSPSGRSLAGSSKAIDRTHVVPPANLSLDRFIDAVAGAVRAGEYDLVFGAGEAEALALSLRREDVGAVVPHPPHEVMRRALDTAIMAETAASCGLASPRTLEPRRPWLRSG